MVTNYERITESPKKLAEFLDEITFRCTMGDSACVNCPLPCNSKKSIKKWLKEECE